MAVITDIADAVVAALNGHEFPQELSVARLYTVENDLEELATLRVAVVPRTMDAVVVSRSRSQFDYQLDVAVQQRVDPSDLAACDALLGLVEEIADFLRGLGRLAGYPAASIVSAGVNPIYGYEHLAQRRVFTSVIRIEVRVFR